MKRPQARGLACGRHKMIYLGIGYYDFGYHRREMFHLLESSLKPLVVIILVAALYLPSSATGDIVETTSADQTSLAITIYNQNIGLVKDTRSTNLPSGMFELKFTDVAKLINVASVHLKSLTDPEKLFILEQNYEFDLVSQDKLLERYLGREIGFETEDGKRLRGILLSHTGGWVVDMDGEIRLDMPGTPILPELPEGLITRPTLLWMLGNDGASKQEVEMSYLTDGMNWVANYVAIVGKNDDMLDLSGWVSITNTSGATYPDATLKLVAGEIHRVMPEDKTKGLPFLPPIPTGHIRERGGFEEEAFFEYHLYTLSRPATLKDNQTKQISLLARDSIPAKKLFIFAPRSYSKRGDTKEDRCDIKLRFKNSEEAGLGIPLPKGTVRVYKADASGMLQFIGEDSIKHTPKDEEITLFIGKAFDVVCERRVMDLRKIADNVWEYDVEVEIRNHKTEGIEVTVVEHVGGDWKVITATHEYIKKDASTLYFTVPAKADANTKLSYTIRRNW